MLRRSLLLALALLSAVGFSRLPARAADHLDAPLLRSQGQGGRDINDVYVFQSPTNPANTVLIMTVNPFAGKVNPFGITSDRTFDPAVEYQLLIDNNNDALPDVTYTTTFTAPVGLAQTLTVARNSTSVASGGTGASLPITGGGLAQAGLFEDPFFFDLVGFNNGFNFTGADTFAGADISAIVLEVPSSQLTGANSNIGVWARTMVGGNQIDRMGRPAINTALIPSGSKDAFNLGIPSADQAAFGNTVRTSLLSLNGGNSAHADQVAGILLPDVLTIDVTNPAGFLNGRRLQDDVIDAALGVVSNGGVTTDQVAANDVVLPNVFPYLAPANFIPEPSALFLGIGACVAMGVWLARRRRPV